MFETQTATIYKSESGRRYFTKKGAIISTARHRFKNKFTCECDYETGYMCFQHKELYGHEESSGLWDRYLRFVLYCTKTKINRRK